MLSLSKRSIKEMRGVYSFSSIKKPEIFDAEIVSDWIAIHYADMATCSILYNLSLSDHTEYVCRR